jgi:hypothetical protein
MFLVAKDVRRYLKNNSNLKEFHAWEQRYFRAQLQKVLLPAAKHLGNADPKKQDLVKSSYTNYRHPYSCRCLIVVVEFRNLYDVSATEAASFIRCRKGSFLAQLVRPYRRILNHSTTRKLRLPLPSNIDIQHNDFTIKKDRFHRLAENLQHFF